MSHSSSKTLEQLAREDIARSRGALPILRLRLDKADRAKADAFGEGLAEVADAVSRSLGVRFEQALGATLLGKKQITGARDDLTGALATCQRHLASEDAAVRDHAGRLSFACELMLHLYTTRLLSVTGPEDLRAEATSLAEGFAALADELRAALARR